MASSGVLTLENLLVRREGFDLPVSALQRAIARAADGRPIGDVLDEGACLAHFGCSRESLGLTPPVLVVLIAGVRSGKSLIAGSAAVKSALTADLSKLKPHEVARVAVVAPTTDNADATFRLLVGHVRASATLAALIVGKVTSDTIVLRRPDARKVEIVVVAALRGAVTLRSRWLAGFVFDEAALFGEEQAGAAITAEELLRAGETRLVPGAQGWVISSPWGPQGLLWEMHKAHFGKPGRTLVVHAPTVAMNPAFDRAQVEAIRARDPDTAAREYDAQWLDASTALLSVAALDRCTRKTPAELPREKGHSYCAAMDSATRGNSWTIVVRTRKMCGDRLKDVIVLARQWTGSKSQPLDPNAVLTEVRAILARYDLRGVYADAYGTDYIRRIAYDCGVHVEQVTTTHADTVDRYQALALRVAEGSVELPSDEYVRRDLMGIRKLARQGGVTIELPRTPDGRHGDYCPAIVLALHRRVPDPTPETKPLSPEEVVQAEIYARRDAAQQARWPGPIHVDENPYAGRVHTDRVPLQRFGRPGR